MSLFDNPEYRWRETYLLFHKKTHRASVDKIRHAISGIRGHYQIEQLVANAHGDFESATVLAEEAFSAIDMIYVEDDQIHEQILEIQTEMKEVLEDPEDLAMLEGLGEYDARIDLLHFERLTGDFTDDEEDLNSCFDPVALLAVADKWMLLTGGVCLDPASATIL
jgi:hypothetical protein